MNFKVMTSPAPGGRINVNTIFGTIVAENEKDVLRIENETRDKMSLKLGRPPTDQELAFGPKANDNRTHEQKARRENFRPVVIDNEHPMAKLAAKYQQAADAKRSVSDSSILEERIAGYAMDVVRRETAEAEAADAEAERLEALQPLLKQAKKVLEAEPWRADSSQAIVDVAQMFIEQATAPNSDPEATAALRRELGSMLDARDAGIRAQEQAIREAADRRIASLQGGKAFADPAPEPVADDNPKASDQVYDKAYWDGVTERHLKRKAEAQRRYDAQPDFLGKDKKSVDDFLGEVEREEMQQ